MNVTRKMCVGLGAACLAGMMLFANPMSADAAEKTVEINESAFPDGAFRDYVKKNVDTSKDGKLSVAEREAVKELFVVGKGIGNAKGVEYFTELTTLDIERNNLTTLDLSGNSKLTSLICRSNADLSELNISKCKELTSLECSNCALTKLDVRQNTKLSSLFTQGNSLGTLDVSKNTELTVLRCYDCGLSGLNVAANQKLNFLDCGQNQLSTLDVTKNPALEMLFCENNKLKTLAIGKNTKLGAVRCYGNQIRTLDISKNTGLLRAYVSEKTTGDFVSYNGAIGEELSVSLTTTLKLPVSKWVKSGGHWFYFNEKGNLQTGWKKVSDQWYYFSKKTGEMAAGEWVNGYWLSKNGTWSYKPRGSWKKDKKGWWYGDTSGWYAKNTTMTIDGKQYSFDAKGYLK